MKKTIFILTLFVVSHISAQNWGEQILNQPNPATSNHFGRSVSIDGNYAVIGSSGENNQTGSAHVYKKDGNGVWNHIQKLTAFVGQHSDEYFGSVVEISGDYIFVSAPTDRLDEVLNQNPTGSVFIFKNDGADNFVNIQRIRASDGAHSDYFGYSLSAEGNTLVVGAIQEDHDASGQNQVSNAGSVYIFNNDGADNWTQTQKIVPNHRASSDNFGLSVTIYGNYIIAGSKNRTDVNNANSVFGDGSVFIFEKDNGGVWNQIQKLKSSDRPNFSLFGHAGIDIYDNYIAVGAPGIYNQNGFQSGAVYIFEKNAGVWTQSDKLLISNLNRECKLGRSVKLEKSYLITTAPEDHVTNGSTVNSAGGAYIFTRNSQGWTENMRISTSNPELNAYVGGGLNNNPPENQDSNFSLDVSGEYFILGSQLKNFDDGGNSIQDAGEVYISGDMSTFVAQNIYWTGALNTTWHEAPNWDINEVPSAIDNVIIPDVVNAPTVQSGRNETINDLTVNDNLTIETYASLTISGNLNQLDTIIVGSSQSASGSLILIGNQLNQTPPATIYSRHVKGNTWQLIASPVEEVDIDEFASNTPLAIGQANPTNRGLGFYDNSNNQPWSYYQAGAVGSGNFISGGGYSVLTTQDTNLQFAGKIMDNDVTNHPITENSSGWNLVGNPFTSFMYANNAANNLVNLIDENSNNLDPLAANLYLWDSQSNRYEPIGNGLDAKYIAPGQGFFVKAKTGGGTMNLRKTMQTHRGENLFLKSKASKKLILNITSGDKTAKTLLAFKKGMTNGLDVTYDAAVFSGEDYDILLYSQLLENYETIKFANQFLPMLTEELTSIPLGVILSENNNITFSIQENTLTSPYRVFLEDRKLDSFIELTDNTSYNFEHDINQNGLGRFYLHITTSSLSTHSTPTKKLVSIYLNSPRTLKVSGLTQEANLYLFDIRGQELLHSIKLDSNNSTINLPQVASGIYIVKLKKKNHEIITKKIVIR